jgi:hypothetical protein
MTLIRRRQSKHPVQKALDLVRLAVRGIVAVRVARNAHKTYKFARRLPLLLGGAAIAVLVARKLRGGKDSEPVTYESPPPAAPRPASAPAAQAPAPASEPAAAPTPTPESAGDGAPSPAALSENGGAMPSSPDLDTPSAGTPVSDGDPDEAPNRAG